MDDDSENGNDTTDSEATRISHKYLCWISVIPQEADQCTDEGADINYEFFRPRNIHNVQITCKLDVRRYVCQDTERGADYGRITCGHSIHSVIQVGTV